MSKIYSFPELSLSQPFGYFSHPEIHPWFNRLSSQAFLYFAHPVNTYGTASERKLVPYIFEFFLQAFEVVKIENPNTEEHCKNYAKWKQAYASNGMNYFIEEVLPKCNCAIFLPFRDNTIGAGVWKEVQYFLNLQLPVWMINRTGKITPILSRPKHLCLSVKETKSRIYVNGKNCDEGLKTY